MGILSTITSIFKTDESLTLEERGEIRIQPAEVTGRVYQRKEPQLSDILPENSELVSDAAELRAKLNTKLSSGSSIDMKAAYSIRIDAVVTRADGSIEHYTF